MKFVKKHIMRIFLFTIFTLFSFSSLSKGYKINGEVKGLSDTTILLAYYFGGNQYAKDTAYSVNGKFTFEGEKELLEGMYLIVLPNQKYSVQCSMRSQSVVHLKVGQINKTTFL